MSATIAFEKARLGTGLGEDAWLGLIDGKLVTVLVRLAEPDATLDDSPWYLETGFGQCAREGLIFASLAAAESWMRAQLD